MAPVNLGAPFPSVSTVGPGHLKWLFSFCTQFLGLGEAPTRTMACFGDNWARLCEIKKEYDPTNLFRNTFWPLDATGEVLQQLDLRLVAEGRL